MATVQGTGGAVSLPTGFNAKHNAWSADIAIETVDTSGFEDNGYRTKEPVIISATGSATGTGEFDTTNTSPIGSTVLAATAGLSSAKGSITLTATTGCTYSFTAVISGVNFNRDVAGKLDVTHNFESSGAITETWDQTA